jgi:hypothetical protein
LINIGVSNSDASSVAKRIQLSVNSMGNERACSFIKNVGDTLLNYLYGSPAKPSWVATTRSGCPKILAPLRGYPEAILVRVAKLARVLRLETVSQKQADKVALAPGSPFSGDNTCVDEMTQLIAEGVSLYNFAGYPVPFEDRPDRIGKFYSRSVSDGAQTPHKGLLKSPDFISAIKLCASVPELRVPGFEHAFWPLTAKAVQSVVSEAMQSPITKVFAGEIHAAQEGGCKLRMFAAPYTIVQCILSPIHNFLDRFRRNIASDCTYDQMSGAYWVQDKLQQDVEIHSVD